MSKISPIAGALCRFEDEDSWQSLESVLVAWDSQPATETQRQRLRKRKIEFDEQTITRGQARELYRNIPERKAQREKTAAGRREARKIIVRKKFPIPEDISDDELIELELASLPSDAALAKLAKLTARFNELGYEIPAPKYQTEEAVSTIVDALESCDYTFQNLKEELVYMSDTGELSREPSSVEIDRLRPIIFDAIMSGRWKDNSKEKAKILCSIAPDIVFTDYGA